MTGVGELYRHILIPIYKGHQALFHLQTTHKLFQVIAFGTEKLEQSDVAEVLITVTEAAVDYFKPPEENAKTQEKAGLPVVQTKVDRIRAVSYTIGDEGTKVKNGIKSNNRQI